MKLSVEARVAAAVAAGFLVVTIGVMAEGNSANRTQAPDESIPTSEPGVHSYVNTPGNDAHLKQPGY